MTDHACSESHTTETTLYRIGKTEDTIETFAFDTRWGAMSAARERGWESYWLETDTQAFAGYQPVGEPYGTCEPVALAA